MKLVLAALLLAGIAAPVAAQKTAKPEAAEPGEQWSSASKADAFDMSKAMAMFDKIFPARPDPAPERLALARFTAGGMLPDGTYAGMFDDIMSDVVERVLALNPGDFGAKDSKGKDAGAATLRQKIAKDDPHFEERMRIIRRVVREELINLSAVMEPKLREGLARSIARRFDEKQLREINGFIATDSGRAFAGQSMRMWIDPDVMRSMMLTFPEMITAMPGAMARLEAATAHLPKPKKKSEKSSKADPST